METSGVLWYRAHGHPPEEVLERYSLLKGSAATGTSVHRAAGPDFEETEECEHLEEHLLLCESCRKQLDECDRWVALMKAAAIPVGHGTGAVAQPVWRRWWKAASETLATGGRIPIPALAGGMLALLAILWVGSSLTAPAGPELTQTVSLAAFRGNDLRVSVHAGSALKLQFDDFAASERGASPASVVIVNAEGHQIWSGHLLGKHAQVPALQKGAYWVRLFSEASGKQFREYGLVAE